jgi:hypothetical protein
MRKNVTLMGLTLMILSLLFIVDNASAQRRYKHLKRVKTEEGFTETSVKNKQKVKHPSIENQTVTHEIMTEEAIASEAEIINETAVASIEKKDKAYAITKEIKKIKIKDLFKEDKLAVTAASMLYSNKALANSKLGRMLAPEKTNEMKPGVLFIIIGSVMAGVALIFWIVGTIVFLGSSGYNFPIYVVFIVLGVLLWFGGLAMIAVGIVKLIKYNRGR